MGYELLVILTLDLSDPQTVPGFPKVDIAMRPDAEHLYGLELQQPEN